MADLKDRFLKILDPWYGPIKSVDEISYYEDPVQTNVFAVRVSRQGSQVPEDFVISLNFDTEEEIRNNVEEVEFLSWPPTSSGQVGFT